MNAITCKFSSLLSIGLAVSLVVWAVPSFTCADTPETAAKTQAETRDNLSQPVYRVDNDRASSGVDVTEQEHPLLPALRFAKAGLEHLDKTIYDYSCTLVKRERIGRTLSEYEYIYVKVRHQPFSVYMYFLGPAHAKGRECIYVDGFNEGKLIAHEGKGFKAKLGVFHLDPNGLLAMRGQRYPITEIGIRNLSARLIEVAEHDRNFGECEVKWFRDTKVDNRKCTCIQVMHPVPRKEFRFHLARVFVDDELRVPIRYEAYQWPTRKGGKPVPDEEYTYVNVKINNGFTDADFEEVNPSYRFKLIK